jgi:hypothetical protein
VIGELPGAFYTVGQAVYCEHSLQGGKRRSPSFWAGGANRGPIEVGALQSLVAHHIKPDRVVGTSAGALNGAYFCAHPDAASVDQLAQIRVSRRRRLPCRSRRAAGSS